MRAPLLILGIAAACIAILYATQPQTPTESRQTPPSRILTTPVVVADIQPISRATGRLVPSRKANLRFEVSGTVVSREVQPGQKVQAGQVLLAIADADLIDAVSRAEADMDQERAADRRDRRLQALIVEERGLQQREVERLTKLGEQHLTSQSKLEEAKRALLRQRAEEARLGHSVATAAARARALKATLNLAQRNLDRARLKAPFAATVNSVAVEQGDYVTPGQAVVELLQLDTLDLYTEVSGNVIEALRLGQTITVRSGTNTRTGTIAALETNPDPSTHTHALRVRLTAEGLRVGALAEVEVPGVPLQQVQVVPLTAILRDNDQAFVFVVEGNRVRRTAVELGPRQLDLQVIAGLQPGTVVAARDVAVLTNGQEVIAGTQTRSNAE